MKNSKYGAEKSRIPISYSIVIFTFVKLDGRLRSA